jgi:hypothetical protein
MQMHLRNVARKWGRRGGRGGRRGRKEKMGEGEGKRGRKKRGTKGRRECRESMARVANFLNLWQDGRTWYLEGRAERRKDGKGIPKDGKDEKDGKE